MRFILTVLMLMPICAIAEVVTVDFVKVINGNEAEAVYYYENNWSRHRSEAAKRGYISSYKLLVKTSVDGKTDILLITGYASESQYADREQNFMRVMRDTQQDGPALLNEKPASEFRELVDQGVYSSD